MTTSRRVTREKLIELVNNFYAEVRLDPLLAPVFGRVVGENWAPHLKRMVEFWCTVALGTRTFQGNVYSKHMVLDDVRPEHFLRWITLWHRHTNALVAPPDAMELQRVAHGIARNLFHGLFGEFALFKMVDNEAVDWTPG